MSTTHVLAQCAAGLSLAATLGAALSPACAQALPEVPVLPGLPELASVPAADPGSRLAPGWQRGPFMQIYVRGYQDSNADGVGDLRGLISRLDYLQALGIRGIWLMPITASQDADHGYAVQNYRAIEPDYGTLADFDALLDAAHQRGIGVILDYVMNHSAAEHPLFALSAKAQKTKPNPAGQASAPPAPANAAQALRDWYVWQPQDPGGWNVLGNNPWREGEHGGVYYAGFAFEMPEFNLNNPAVVAWHHDNLRFWLNRGVDGFRFDAVGNLVENGPLAWESQPQSHALMRSVRQLVDGYANRYMVCEAPGDALGFAAPSSGGSAFFFGHQNRIVAAALGSPAALEQLSHDWQSLPAGVGPERLATFASNHDSFAGQRLWDRVRGDSAAYRLAAASYLLQPGVPFIYYGEEVGMAGGRGLGGDHKLRPPMSWTADAQTAGFTSAEPFRALSANVASHNVAAQVQDPGSLLHFYKQLIALRHSRPSLAAGAYVQPLVAGWTLSFQRQLPTETTLVLLNYGSKPAKAPVSGLPARARLTLLWASSANLKPWQSDGRGRAELLLPAQSVAVFAVQATGSQQ